MPGKPFGLEEYEAYQHAQIKAIGDAVAAKLKCEAV